jgi:hypothetical protein
LLIKIILTKELRLLDAIEQHTLWTMWMGRWRTPKRAEAMTSPFAFIFVAFYQIFDSPKFQLKSNSSPYPYLPPLLGNSSFLMHLKHAKIGKVRWIGGWK